MNALLELLAAMLSGGQTTSPTPIVGWRPPGGN